MLDHLVPPHLLRRLVRCPALPEGPEVEAHQAALLLADLSGFSTLAEQFALRGVRGAEDLRELLNRLFGRLVDDIAEHGGEVVKFAGDATLAIWPAEGDDLGLATCRAAGWAQAAAGLLDGVDEVEGARLQLRVGLGAGTLHSAVVGGIGDRWELVTAGAPLAEAALGLERARPGEVIAGPTAAALLAPRARLSPLSGGGARLLELATPARAKPLALPPLPQEAGPALAAFVPRTVRERLLAGQTDWLAEFRTATVLFVNFHGIDFREPDAVDRLQRATRALQEAVRRHEGSVLQLLVDDKGTVAVCGWGLALHAHEDDAARATRAALELRQALQQESERASCGIATGRVFTGFRGNARRAEYAMIGSVVNLAARLMQAAEGRILCEEATRLACRHRVGFETLPPIRVKGREAPVGIFEPRPEPRRSGPAHPLIVGRRAERAALAAGVSALLEAGRGSTLVLEGEAGMGKSLLLAELAERVSGQTGLLVTAAADAVERSTPYYPWRAAIIRLLDLEDVEDLAARELRVRSRLGEVSELEPYLALLNPVLRMAAPETEALRDLTPRGRAAATERMLMALFRGATVGRWPVLVLEDAHWFDSASWALAERLATAGDAIFLVLALRPFDGETIPVEYARLREQPDLVFHALTALSPAETEALVRDRLGAVRLQPDLARFVHERGGGHPFFSEELAQAVRDRGLITIENGIAGFAETGGPSETVAFPDTIQAVIGSRIDQLTPQEQLTLKVSSVLGRTFDLAALLELHPLEAERAALPEELATLTARGLLIELVGEAERSYEFRHAIIQDVAYGLLPFAQRRQLHRTVAGWYEQRHAADLSAFYGLLAHHWKHAEAGDRAVYFLDRAGVQAFGRYANEEALRFFREALDLDQTLAKEEWTGTPRATELSQREVRRVAWRRYMGEACVNLGRWSEGWDHLAKVLHAVGRPLPDGPKSLRRALLREVGVQWVHRLRSLDRLRVPGPTRDLLCNVVRSYTRLGGLAYVGGRDLELLYMLLSGLNVAERTGSTPELALAYADAGNIAGMVPLHRLAKSYGRRARRIAHEVGQAATTAKVLGRTAIYRTAAGEWGAGADVERSMELAEHVGDPYIWQEGGSFLGLLSRVRGQYERSYELGLEVVARARRSATGMHIVWGLDLQAVASCYLGRLDEAATAAAEALDLLVSSGRRDRIVGLNMQTVLAQVHLARGEIAEARNAMALAFDELAQAARPSHHAYQGIGDLADCHLWLHDLSLAGERPALLERIETLAGRLRRHQRIAFPGRARTFLVQGGLAWRHRRPGQARKLWSRALAEAGRFGLPYEEARAHFELARPRRGRGSGEAGELRQAQEIFHRIGARLETERVAAALAGDWGVKED